MKGAVWTVDEIEFHRRRPQKAAGNGYVHFRRDGHALSDVTRSQTLGIKELDLVALPHK